MKFLKITILTLAIFTLSYCNSNSQKQITNPKQAEISADTSFNFENYDLNTNPQDWQTDLTGKGKICEWKILNDNNNKILAQTSNEKQSYRFNLITNKNLYYKNLQISVRFKGISGKKDQGGGPVWRYIDKNNYYVARANPLENNFRVYKVVNGNRKELKSADIEIDSNKWYNIKIIMNGNKIKCYFNGKLELETTDNTFPDAGKIGLWTKSDAVTYFDNLKILSK